ncbi:hypothetical protein AXK56_16755 [Tsukamurella pulmonis]|uniref:Uncharacterized protein n=1 Tax=Tsukamurella pulmonis TaxID=47312 RepID=A0A1H1ACL4_9ACTN|nr:hypothetical protein AXK56_16755 [Tsukamurella pulmonis]SDQ37433.1 hypothetical protein SAMN04489765_0161 [Tsukamurella pulmonis]SUQ39375.1 Uncharacterised protein [Tsukamurella pulmonis]
MSAYPSPDEQIAPSPTAPEDRYYDESLLCTACGEHFADPHAPECDEQFEAAHGDDDSVAAAPF